MSSRRLIQTAIILMMGLTLLTGCPRKPVVAPGQGTPSGPLAPYGQLSMDEQQLQAVQASLKSVYFDYDRYTLSPQGQADLQENAELLKRVPQIAVVAEGHCDERGTAEYNLALGDRRARAAVDYLVSLGLPPNRFSIVSYGSELPTDPGHNEQAWSQNRRAAFRVSR
jgi:peptidoglycan-associated lipoprotein